jgi:dihydroorotate dehydrogenase (fumarate)
MGGQDVVKLILAGASCVQVVSTLFKNKVSYLGTMVKELETWMNGKGYAAIEDFRGKLSAQNNPDPWVYKRAQYVRLLLKPDWMG